MATFTRIGEQILYVTFSFCQRTQNDFEAPPLMQSVRIMCAAGLCSGAVE